MKLKPNVEYQPKKVMRSWTDGILTGLWRSGYVDSVPELESGNLKGMRSSSRELVRKVPQLDWYTRYRPNQVLGPKGVRIRVRVLSASGSEDPKASALVMSAWNDFRKAANYMANGRVYGLELDHQILKNHIIDGESIILIRSGGKYGIQLEYVEPARLDESPSKEVNGNKVYQGVEYDSTGRVVAYHIFDSIPGSGGPAILRRYPANTVIHFFEGARPNFHRGIPLTAVIKDLIGLRGDATEFAAAALQKSTLITGAITSEKPTDGYAQDQASTSEVYMSVSPDTPLVRLAPGEKINPVDWAYPNNEFAPFVEALDMPTARGLDMAYAKLMGSLKDVNFSTLKMDNNTEQEHWKWQQDLFINKFLEPLFQIWLNTKQTKSFTGISNPALVDVKFSPRGWDSIQPDVEIPANINSLNSGQTTLSIILAEKGIDFEEHVAELVRERQILKDNNLSFKDFITDPSLILDLNSKAMGLPGINGGLTAQDPTTQDQNAAPTPPQVPENPVVAENVQGTALNGAQVQSLLLVVQNVASGLLPKETAADLIKSAFPGIPPTQVDAMLAPIQPGSIQAVPASTPSTTPNDQVKTDKTQPTSNRAKIF